MKTKKLEQVSSEELLKELKKLKTSKIIDAALVGFSIGVMAYGAIKSGFNLFTFFPLLVVYLVVRNSKNNKTAEEEIKEELRSRGQ